MKKHKLVLLSISLGMIMLSCGNISNTDFDSKNSNENIERNKRNGESIQSQNDNKNQTGSQIEKTDYQITDAKATRFGNRTVGYISLGNGWKQLENTEGQGEITYIGYDESSITLYLTPVENMNAKGVANEALNKMSKTEEEQEKLKLSKIQINGYNGYQVSIDYSNGISFRKNYIDYNGNVYLIDIIGKTSNIDELLKIAYTWKPIQ